MRPEDSHLAIGPGTRAAALSRLLFASFCGCVFLRLFLNANVLNEVIDYTADGGALVEKVHPSTYGMLLILVATLSFMRIRLNKWERRALRGLLAFALVIGVIAVFALLTGHSDSIGYLIDSYLATCAGGALMLFAPRPWRRRLGAMLIVFIAASALLAVGEFALQTRLLPYPLQELSFRPTGLAEHPLVLGLYSVLGINFVAASRWRTGTKAVLIVIMLVGAIAAGARIATIVAAVSVLAAIALHESPSVRRRARLPIKALLFLSVFVVGLTALAMLISFGVLDRFQTGLFDENAFARIDIYGLFALVSWREILLGADISEIRRLALEHLNLEFIESPLVLFIFQFGLFGTAFFLLFLARTFFVLIEGASRQVALATFAFFIVASSNNSLASKTPIVLLVVLLIIAFRDRPYNEIAAADSRSAGRARAIGFHRARFSYSS